MADILVVDDDRDIGDSVADILRVSGHEVRVARNGREGLARIAERKPDLVLLDVEMPLLSGPDMAYVLFLRNCGDERIPIVLASGVVGLERIAARIGTPYFLSKPYDVNALLRLVEHARAEHICPVPGRGA